MDTGGKKMTKMVDMGQKRGDMGPVATVAENKTVISYPSLTLDSNQLPGIEKFKVGDTGCMDVEYIVKGSRLRDSGETVVDFDTRKIGLCDEPASGMDEGSGDSNDNSTEGDTKDMQETARMRLKGGRTY